MPLVEFKDGSQINAQAITASTQYIQGVNRDVMEFTFTAEGQSLDLLNDLFSDDTRTEEIIIHGLDENEQPAQYLYNGYVVRTAKPITLANELVTPETAETDAVYEARIKIELAQQTRLERIALENSRRIDSLALDNAASNLELFMMLVPLLSLITAPDPEPEPAPEPISPEPEEDEPTDEENEGEV